MISEFIVKRSSILRSCGVWIVAVGAALLLLIPGSMAQSYGSRPDITEIKQRAEKGEPVMQRAMGLEYIEGKRVEKSDSQALLWLTRAGNSGDAQAQYMVANMYEYGRGTSKDMTEAINWYRKAAAQGVVHAQFNLGDSYLRGIGVQKDLTEAMKWFKMAADQKDPDAMVQIGVAYLTGKGLPMNYAEAASNLRAVAYDAVKSDLQPMAQYYWGVIHRDGLGYTPDASKAATWFKQSALGGFPDGMYAYAQMLSEGTSDRGVDKVTAWEWYEKAAKLGHPEATVKIQKTDRHNGKGVPVASAGAKDPTKQYTEAEAKERGYGRLGAEPEEYTKVETAVVDAVDSGYKEAEKGIATLKKSFESGELGSSLEKSLGSLGNLSGLTGGETEPKKSESPQSIEERAIAAAKSAYASSSKGTTPSFKTAEPVDFASTGKSFSATPSGAPAIPSAFAKEPKAPAIPKSSSSGFGKFTSEPKAASTAFKKFGAEPKKSISSGSSFTSPNPSAIHEKEQARMKAELDAKMASSGFGKLSTGSETGSSIFDRKRAETTKSPSERSSASANSFSAGPGKADSTAGGFNAAPKADAGAGKAAAADQGPSSEGEAAAAPFTPAPRPQVEYIPGESGFPVGIAYITLAMATAMVFISLMFFFTFKTRVHSLESEIKKAQFELSKANVNLSSMMHQVEQLALQAPGEEESGQGIVSLPDWGDQTPQPQGEAEGFKISRPR